MPTLHVNGFDMYVEQRGEGDPLFLIHGLGCDHTIWQLQTEELSKNYTVIAYDARGHGKISRMANFTLEDHARDLAALFSAFKVEKAHIMGLSMGTYICQQFVSMYPEKVDRMILAATRPAGQTSAMQVMLEKHLSAGEPIDIHAVTHMASKACFRPGISEEKLAIFYQSTQYNTLESYMAAMRALTNFDFRPVLPHVKASTLIVNGDEDILTTLSEAKEVHSLIPDSQLVVFEQCGHLCNIEQSHRFNKTVLSFLAN